MSLFRAGTRTTVACLRSHPSFSRSVATNNAKPTAPLEAQNPIPEDLPLVPAEAHDVIVADTISGAPRELRLRTVRIFQPTRNTMQSGGAKGERWRIEFDTLPGSGRWENPLMGYASSADYMQGTRITFRSKDDAIHFAEKQGWDYYVQQETVKRVPPKNYSENYLYKADKLRILKTK